MERQFPVRGELMLPRSTPAVWVLGTNGPSYYRIMFLDGQNPVGTPWDVPRDAISFEKPARPSLDGAGTKEGT